MLEKITEKFGRVKEVFTAMPTSRKVVFLSLATLVLSSFIVLMIWTNKVDYQIIYSGLSQQDAGAIVAKLKEKKIPFQLGSNGSAIQVPSEMVEETRLFLATEGLPSGGAIGMEVFDGSSLGETDFMQHLKYQRALQGELERTIKKFAEVDQARIHLNIPKESVFIEDSKAPSASVVLRLHAGRTLSRSQLAGIVHLVSSSVEGLRRENISIVDTAGGLLYSKDEEEEKGLLTASQIQYRQGLEKSLSERVTSMLERVVGPHKAISRVTADLNFQQVTANEEIYDPDRSAIRSEQRIKELNQGPPRGAAGTPNPRYQLGTDRNQETGDGLDRESYERTEDTTNYEVTKINRQVVTPAGDVDRLSVAVMVDGTYEEVEKDGVKTKNFIPLPQPQLAKLEELVKNAVGFDETRGDNVVVSSVPFYMTEEAGTEWWMTVLDNLRQFGKPAFNVLLIVLFFLFVVRPVMSWLQREIQPAEEKLPSMETEALPEGEGAEAEALPEPGKLEPGKLTRDQVLALARQHPDRTLNLIRAWIDEV
ncbi:MAG: flagellar basal-body MS-ring/collar protein FliF [Pseudomonadota bacterium]